MFLLIHWLFTAHYLKAACLLKPTIAAINTGDILTVDRIKKWLRLLELSVFAIVVVFFSVMSFERDTD